MSDHADALDQWHLLASDMDGGRLDFPSWSRSMPGGGSLPLLAARQAYQESAAGWERWAAAASKLVDFATCELQEDCRRAIQTVLTRRDERGTTVKVPWDPPRQAEHLLLAWLATFGAFAGAGDPQQLLQSAAERFEQAWGNVQVHRSPLGNSADNTDDRSVRGKLNRLLASDPGRAGLWLVKDLVDAVVSDDEPQAGALEWPLPVPVLFAWEAGGKVGDWQLDAKAETSAHGIVPSPARLGLTLLAPDWQDALNTAWELAGGRVWPCLLRWWLPDTKAASIEGRSAEAAFYCGLRAFREERRLNRFWVVTATIKGNTLGAVKGVEHKLPAATHAYRRKLRGVFLSPDQPKVDWQGMAPLKVTSPQSLQDLYEKAQGVPELEAAVDRHRRDCHQLCNKHLSEIGYVEPALDLGAAETVWFGPAAGAFTERPGDDQQAPAEWQDATPITPAKLLDLRRAHQLVCITNDSGIGKTELAYWMERDLSAPYIDPRTGNVVPRYDHIAVRLGTPGLDWPTRWEDYASEVVRQLRQHGGLRGSDAQPGATLMGSRAARRWSRRVCPGRPGPTGPGSSEGVGGSAGQVPRLPGIPDLTTLCGQCPAAALRSTERRSQPLPDGAAQNVRRRAAQTVPRRAALPACHRVA